MLVSFKKIQNISYLKVNKSAILMIYDACWQGLLEECEVFLEVLRASCREVSEESIPSSFLGGRTFPIAHMLAAVEKLKNIMGRPYRRLHPLATAQVSVFYEGAIVPEPTDTFPWQEKGDDSPDWI